MVDLSFSNFVKCLALVVTYLVTFVKRVINIPLVFAEVPDLFRASLERLDDMTKEKN